VMAIVGGLEKLLALARQTKTETSGRGHSKG
jgi:hypothetical protein